MQAVRHLEDLGAAGRATDEGHVAGVAPERLRHSVEGGSGRPAVNGGNLDGDDEGGVAVASADPRASSAGLDPDLEADG